ncbi:hypothetical protein T4B_5366 [Trichinella pseudospiralis]|uniref:Uncharacterized protein n=1 Tax=Trichinella pseudospiralis TaxID=6337 RepID=A0A0V1JAG0_TRIPS|nr:hypothetical protein T4B_5366 [Trichinella pseudospiralis]KRZ44557.1 hypothetical protein T4C_12522 [Trichinella pseudospiralis]
MRDAKFIMGNKRILPIFICEQTTTTGAASEIVKSQRNGTQNVKIYRDADALSGKECQQCWKHSTQADISSPFCTN